MYDIVFAKANNKHTECVITPNRPKTVITIFSIIEKIQLQNIQQLSSVEPASCSIKEKYMNELSSCKNETKGNLLIFFVYNFWIE